MGHGHLCLWNHTARGVADGTTQTGSVELAEANRAAGEQGNERKNDRLSLHRKDLLFAFSDGDYHINMSLQKGRVLAVTFAVTFAPGRTSPGAPQGSGFSLMFL